MSFDRVAVSLKTGNTERGNIEWQKLIWFEQKHPLNIFWCGVLQKHFFCSKLLMIPKESVHTFLLAPVNSRGPPWYDGVSTLFSRDRVERRGCKIPSWVFAIDRINRLQKSYQRAMRAYSLVCGRTAGVKKGSKIACWMYGPLLKPSLYHYWVKGHVTEVWTRVSGTSCHSLAKCVHEIRAFV